jgi:PAS domain S-box-containing protein
LCLINQPLTAVEIGFVNVLERSVIMTAFGKANWEQDQAKAVSWRIEKETVVKPQSAAFFPDQNGGVYEKLLSTLPVALHCMDASGRLISVNRQWCETFGYPLHEVLGRAFSEFLPPESRSKLVTTIYPKYLTSSACRSEEILFIRKDGSLATVLLSMTAYRGEKGRLDRSVCMLEDITEQKIARGVCRVSSCHGGDFANGPN